MKLVWIALGGAAGTLLRYALSFWVDQRFSKHFPWAPIGTLTVNGIGCFLFGWVWTFTEKRLIADTEVRVIVLVGFLGAFTTFSTYIFQSGQFLSHGKLGFALSNFAIQNIVGFCLLYLGAVVGSR